jgi:hypothetical protein
MLKLDPLYGSIGVYGYIQLPVYISQEMKSAYKRDTCVPMFTVALVPTAKIWDQPRCLSTVNQGNI